MSGSKEVETQRSLERAKIETGGELENRGNV